MKFNPPKPRTLAQWMMVEIIPVSLGGILLMGLSAFYVTKVYITRNVEREIAAFSQGAAAGVAGYFAQRENDLATLSETPLLADYYHNADYGLNEEAQQYRRELGRHFLRFAKRTGVYNRIAYVDPSGKLVSGIKNGAVAQGGTAPGDRELLAKAAALKAGGVYRSAVLQDPEHGPEVLYARPVFDAAGAFRGVVALEASLKPLQETLAHLRAGSHGATVIADQAGSPVLKADGAEGPEPGSEVSAAAHIAGTDLQVVAAAPLSDFQAPLKAISRFTLALMIICAGLVALFIYLTISTVTRPIKTLVDATRDLASGALTQRVAIKSRDEIGTLGEAFNTMAERLMKSSDELKSRVKELLVLQGMSSELIEKLEESHICRLCLKAAAAAIGLERGVMYLVNRDRSLIEGRYVHFTEQVGFGEDKMRLRAVPLDGGDLLAEVVRGKKPVNIKDPAAVPGANPRFIEEVGTKAFCLVPMMRGDTVIGVIGADNYYSGREITEEQVKNLSLFANFTALALENAKLVTDVKASEERYRTVLDNSPDAIIGLDPAFRVTVWNSGARGLFGYAPEEILGRHVSTLFEPLAYECASRELARKGFFSGSPVEGRRAGGGKLELDVIWAGSGKAGGGEWTVVIRDTSEQRKLQSQLIQAEKLSAVGQLISGVAHELNNPLTAILGYSEVMKMTQPDPAARRAEDVDVIFESAVRCGEIVRNLLAFVRESRGRREAVDVARIAASSIALVSYRLKKADNIDISISAGDHLPPALADYHQIEQILVNLIQNACDALAQKAGEKKITVSLFHKGSAMLVSVSDNGPGVPAELREKIFEPFYTSKEEGQGTGLGLAICRRIAAEHGGTITCGEAREGGAAFTLELPIVKLPAAAAAAEETVRKLPPGKRVLAVDDEPGVLSLVKRILEKEGQTVETAASGLEAVEKLSKNDYDLVICDVEMGPLKGFSVREAMLEMNSRAALVFTTGNLLNPDIVRKLRALKVPFLPKPFHMNQLIAAMEEALR